MPALHEFALQWRSFSDDVVADGNLSCLLFSASKVPRRVQPTAARWSDRFNKMHGDARIARVSQQSSSTYLFLSWTLNKNNIINMNKEFNW